MISTKNFYGTTQDVLELCLENADDAFRGEISDLFEEYNLGNCTCESSDSINHDHVYGVDDENEDIALNLHLEVSDSESENECKEPGNVPFETRKEDEEEETIQKKWRDGEGCGCTKYET